MFGLNRNNSTKREAQPEKKEPGLGLIRGPGTGTSDSIPAKLPRGSYIMPADSTDQIGADRLAQMGARGLPGFNGMPRGKVDARVSKGEFGMPPEQVHAVGVQALDQLRDATHAPKLGLPGYKPKTQGTESKEPGLGLRRPPPAAPAQEPKLGLRRQPPAEPAPAPKLGFRMPDGSLPFKIEEQAPGLGLRRTPPAEPAPAPKLGLPGFNNRRSDATPQEPGLGLRRPGSRQPLNFADGGMVDDETRLRSAPGSSFTRSPTMGETMNQTNTQRAERTGTGLYGTPRTGAQIASDRGLPGYQDRVNAIPGASPFQLETSARLSNPQGATSPLAGTTTQPTSKSVPSAPAAGVAPSAVTTPSTPFADWQSSASQQERDKAADGYREAWQAQAPRGLQRAGRDATTLYNAEQATRGTGITATRGPNGVMSFSGDGANALPQSYTQGIDMNLGNERMARANQIRAGMGDLQAQRDFGSGAALSRQMSQEEIERGLLTGSSRSGRQVAAGLMNSRREAEIAQQQQALEGQRFGLDRQRLGIEQQRAETDARARGYELRGLERIEGLQQQFETETDPAKRAQLAERLRVLTGRERDTAGLEKARIDLVGNLYKTYAEQKAYDKDNKMPLFDQWAAPALGMAGGGQSQGAGQQQSLSRPVGATSRVGGRTAVWDGAKWVERT
ncbi:hypothetical protein [Parazoarcus communis]|uniref:Uncharacterized protein n=1 Tax=Parazoarcus communis SWub3 = DSM 12120 TaxID=1121029 RepID=A0A323USG3_9RHOO|nr:hypothetical protein [Parazoarcus communis]NMG71853.1 hypothetical protein [Parazoarcus communis SWub3 = DSM 12120]PZA14963.1 hypothetical protein DNK49_19155 [Azoarcus communis] [Parazoarcus communis SWub3 = DSM 12120]